MTAITEPKMVNTRPQNVLFNLFCKLKYLSYKSNKDFDSKYIYVNEIIIYQRWNIKKKIFLIPSR